MFADGRKKKRKIKKKVQFADNVKMPKKASMLCTIDGNTFFHSQRTHGLDSQEHSVTSQIMIPVSSMSLAPTSQFMEAPGTCQL